MVRGLLRGDFGLNVISTRFFAEGEFWFSLVKVITIIAFIILGGAAIFGFIPMQDGSPAPGLSNITAEGWFPHGGLPILMTMVAVNFAFSGTELIGIAAGETENPHKVIPVAIRATIARLIIFFIGTVFVLAALIPMQQAGVEKMVAVWISICASSHFVFRRRHLQSGQPLSALLYRAPWYPLVPVLGFILCVVASACGLIRASALPFIVACRSSPCVMVPIT